MVKFKRFRIILTLTFFTLFIICCSKEDQGTSCNELRMFPDSTESVGFMSFACLNDSNRIFTVNGKSHLNILSDDSVSVLFSGNLDGVVFEKSLTFAVVCDTFPGNQPFLRILESSSIASGSITENILNLYFNEPICSQPARIWGNH